MSLVVGRPLVLIDDVIRDVRARLIRVTVARIHPLDAKKMAKRVPLDVVATWLGVPAVLESSAVDRGMLFIETQER